MKLFNRTKNLVVIENVKRADSYWSRMVGLLGTPSLPHGNGLWLFPCYDIQTFFMRYPLDIVFVTTEMRVKSVHENVPPWRLLFSWGAESAFEMPVGTIQRGQVAVGDQLDVGD